MLSVDYCRQKDNPVTSNLKVIVSKDWITILEFNDSMFMISHVYNDSAGLVSVKIKALALNFEWVVASLSFVKEEDVGDYIVESIQDFINRLL